MGGHSGQASGFRFSRAGGKSLIWTDSTGKSGKLLAQGCEKAQCFDTIRARIEGLATMLLPG
jgi:hypothetical protein